MFARSSRRFVSLVILFGVVALLVAGGSTPTANAAANGCEIVEGRVTIQAADQCSSPYGCGTGKIKGDIKGTFSVVSTNAIPLMIDPATPPYALFVTADTVFQVTDGTLTSKDASTISMITGEYAEIITITGGTGRYAGATGVLTAVGTTNLASGSGSGTYSGKICLP